MIKAHVFILTLILLVGIALPPSKALATEVVEVASRTGVKAWFVEDHSQPIIAVRFAFRGGVEQDSADQQGLAELTMNLLSEGAGDRDAAAFQKTLADHSISLSFSASRDALEGGLKCLSEDKTLAFQLLHDALTKPRFDTASFDRLRERQRAALRSQLGSPEWQVRYSLFQHIYGDHPYGYRRLGTERSLAALSPNDVKKFYNRHLARDNLVIGITGDIGRQELMRMLDGVFRDLPERARLNTVRDIRLVEDHATIVSAREGMQTSLLFALPGLRRDDPDWYAAEVANYIVGGGGFSSRLMHKVRDEKGLTYGISTGLSAMDHGALILGQAATKNADAGEALRLIRSTLQDAVDDGVSDAEVDQAKDFLIGSLPLALTSRDKIADVLVSFQLDKRGRDYLTRRVALLRAVSRADVERVLKKYFAPDKMVVSLVGKPDGVTASENRPLVRE